MRFKTDNRGVGIAYVYDALNRLQSKTYFNLPNTVNYQAIGYTYDDPSVPFSRGRLTASYTLPGTYRLAADVSLTKYLAYDPLGRITASSQTTGGSTYPFRNYSYNLADALTSETYPSGRVVQTCYDNVNRVSQVGGVTCGNIGGAFASTFTYAAHGAPTQYVMGNNVWHAPAYNARLQMSGFVDSVAGSSSDQLLNVSLTWNAPQSANNNGNLWGATYNNGGPGFAAFLTFTQSMTYDGVNRLSGASDSGGWTRTYTYDAFGNMTPSGSPAPPTESFNGNNQIVGGSYNQAGQQLSVNGNAISYEYEGMIASETDGISQAVETYVYDGDGRRVRKYGSGGSPATTYVYDAQGLLAAEYSNAANNSACLTCYLTPDHLGTIRLITDQNGNVVSRHDYLPFGEEVGNGAYGRTNQWNNGADSVNQKFTGKERDSESGLDYFGARYYGSPLGRFSSPDDGTDQHPEDPQSWNLYAYVRNNPLTNTDPTGRDCLQGVSSCLNYIAGGLKAVGNIPSDIYNAPNRVVDALISPFTSFRIGDAVSPTFTPSNTDQAQGMNAANVMMLLSPLAETGAAKVADAAEVGSQMSATGPSSLTADQIKAGIQDAPLKTGQDAISGPAVNRYVEKINAGQTAPPIKVDGDVIVDGNHRYAAGQLTGQPPAMVPGTASPTQIKNAKPFGQVKVDPKDWGNQE